MESNESPSDLDVTRERLIEQGLRDTFVRAGIKAVDAALLRVRFVGKTGILEPTFKAKSQGK